MRRLFIPVLLAVAAQSGAVLANDGRCFATWTEAAPVVHKEALVAVEQVSNLARASLGGAEVVKTTLCQEQGRYIYRLVLREPKGQLKTVSVDARKPFVP